MTKYNKIIENSLFKNALSEIMKKEKTRIFCRHSMEHCLDVARIAYILTLENNIDISRDLIYSTALLHDIGRAFDDEEHDKMGVDLAEKILKECDYKADEISEITNAILNHRNDVTALNSLSDVICKADKLSRQCFDCNAQAECYWTEERRNKYIKY